MGNVIKSCPPNLPVRFKTVNFKNINSSCVQCSVSSFDAGTCDKTCDDGSGNSVLTQNRTIITQPIGGWTCPPLTQTTSPCIGLPACTPAVVSTMFTYTDTRPLDFTITSNNNMYILFNSYILQINLLSNVSKNINLSTYGYNGNIIASNNDDILYLYDTSLQNIIKYTVSSGNFDRIPLSLVLSCIVVVKDSLQNDIIYFYDIDNSCISKMYFDNSIDDWKDERIYMVSSFITSITIDTTNDVIYVTDYNSVKKIYKNNDVYMDEIIASNNGPVIASVINPSGITFNNNNLYVSDTDNNCIRKINLSTNTVSTIAGSTSQLGGNLDGVGVNNSLFNNPQKIIFFNKVLYVLDSGNYSIRKVVDFVKPICSSILGYNYVPNNTNICECAIGYTGTFNYTDNIISGCNKIYPSQKGYIGKPGNYSCDTSQGFGGTVVYGDNSLSGCTPIPCTTKGYTGTAGSCVCISGYNGVVTYTYDGTLGGCTPKTYTLTKGYTGEAGNYTCDITQGYEGSTVLYGDTSLFGCTPKTYTLTTGYTGTPGNYTCDISKGYGGTISYNSGSLSGCNLMSMFYIIGIKNNNPVIIYSYNNNNTFINVKNYDSSFSPGSIYYNSTWKLWVSATQNSGSNAFNTFAYSDNPDKWTISTSKAMGNSSLDKVFDSNNDFCIAVTNTSEYRQSNADPLSSYETYQGIGTFLTMMYYSTDGKIWNPIKGFTNRNKYCMAFGPKCIKFADNKFVAGLSVVIRKQFSWVPIDGGFSMLVSTSSKPKLGSEFTPVKCFNHSCYSIDFANGKWIAVGIQQNLQGVDLVAYSISNDAITWNTPTNINSLNYNDYSLVIKYGYNNVWMIGGRGNIHNYLVSTDNGNSWNPKGGNTDTFGVLGIRYINNTWYSYGYGTNLLKSTDNGTTWSVIDLSAYCSYIYCLGWNGIN